MLTVISELRCLICAKPPLFPEIPEIRALFQEFPEITAETFTIDTLYLALLECFLVSICDTGIAKQLLEGANTIQV